MGERRVAAAAVTALVVVPTSSVAVAAPTGGNLARVSTVNLVVAAVALALAGAAVVGVLLAARIYGGRIGQALTYVGGGVTVFSLERLWYAGYAVGFVPQFVLGDPAGPGSAISMRNLLLLGAAGLLAIGFFELYQTMARQVR